MSNCNVDVNCLESENDSEMSEMLSRKSVELFDVPEKPLSPVLSRSRVNRRNLFSKKAKHKKSKVNLSQQFERVKEDTIQLQVKEFDDESLTVSQTDGLIDRIEKLEEIERNRQNFHKLITSNKQDDFCFKKPILTPGKIKKIKINSRGSKVCDNVVDKSEEDEIYFKYLTDYKCVLPQSPGFQTATGNKIDIADNQIKNYSLLFNDILNSSQTCDVTRCNKYKFLSKNKAPEERTKHLCNRNTLENVPICSSDLKFSEFSGFTREEITESKVLLHDLQMVYKNIDNLHDLSIENQYSHKKHKLNEKNSPPSKRLKQENDSKNIDSSAISNKLLDFPSKVNSLKADLAMGFLKASGKSITLTDNSINKAKKMFSSMENSVAIESTIESPNRIDCKTKLELLNEAIKCLETRKQASACKIKKTNHSIRFSKASVGNNEGSKSLLDQNEDDTRSGTISNSLREDSVLGKPKFVRSLASGFETVIENCINSNGSELGASENLKPTENYFNQRQGQKRKFSQVSNFKLVVPDSMQHQSSNSITRITLRNKLALLDNTIKDVGTGKDSYSNQLVQTFNEVSDLHSGTSTRNNAIWGFSKASGVTIDFTETSLQRAKSLFSVVENVSLDSDIENQEPSESITRITSRSKMKQLNDAIKEAEKDMDITKIDAPCPLPSNNLERTFCESSNIKYDITVNKNWKQGFSRASGVAIHLTEKSMQKAKSLFSDIENQEPSESVTRITSRNKLKQLNVAIKEAEKNMDITNIDAPRTFPSCNLERKFGESSSIKCDNTINNNYKQGFARASGVATHLTEKSMQSAKGLFSDIENQEPTESLTRITSRNKLKLLDDAIKEAEKNMDLTKIDAPRPLPSNNIERKFGEPSNTKCDNTINNNCKQGFARASGVAMNLTEKSMQKAQDLFSDIENQESLESITRITSRNKLKVLDDAIKEAEKNMNITEEHATHPLLSSFKPKPIGLRLNINKSMDANSSSSPAYSTPIKTNQNRTYAKKKLGISSYQVIPISESKLHKAKLLFGEDLSEPSPIKPSHTSTPLKPTLLMGSSLGIIDSTTLDVDSNNDNIVFGKNSAFVIVPPTKINIEERVKEFGEEIERLQALIRVLTERQIVLHGTKTEKNDSKKKPRVGALYNNKRNSERISLSTLMSRNCMEDNDFAYVNPRNAENFHFKETSLMVTTADGATVIPSIKDLIGLSEIELGFHAMPGVDPRLLPKGWLKNHYKWVVWKLARYEHMYPDDLKGCLSVENIMQQLKYRYDREIDKAERPALRRILEKDDAPQKRLILCVSDIKTSEHELELTDGWYPVRTVVDELLYRQVMSGRIRVGTKLVITGAELLNCDGCHPLEVTDLTCLKINYNCTRRAIWHAKLGYQHFPGPFPIRIATVHPLGGAIGAIRICIVRTYPMKYLERMGTNTVWRNQKAEERRAQDWENEQLKRMEKIEEGIRKEFSNSFKCPDQDSRLKNITNEELSSISNPKLLFQIVETSNDPDNILENLTVSQRSALMDYRRRMDLKTQQEINARIKENVEKLKLVKRDVSAVLRLLVVDASEESSRHYNFFIWHPNESHEHLLKEKTLLTVYNIQPRKNGDLNSTSKTVFKPTSGNFIINGYYERRVIDIENLPRAILPPSFKDFDTVGIVVGTTVETNKQEVWLTGLSGRLLLVEIIEGPNQCLLLDNLRRGNATTACNLLYCGFKDGVVYAMANHYTIFSSYSQYKHLQEGLEMFKTKLPQDLNVLLDDCDNSIDMYRQNPSTSTKFKSFSKLDDSDEDTLVQSRLTSTDVALSLIDIDNLV